jgi:hypothetical protein
VRPVPHVAANSELRRQARAGATRVEVGMVVFHRLSFRGPREVDCSGLRQSRCDRA